jgi:prevent-host-death family protein
MKTLTAKEAKNRFGRLLDLARVEPVTVARHGLPVVVVVSIEEFDRLTKLEHPSESERWQAEA